MILSDNDFDRPRSLELSEIGSLTQFRPIIAQKWDKMGQYEKGCPKFQNKEQRCLFPTMLLQLFLSMV